MADPQSDDSGTPGARMVLEPDAVHEETDEPTIDCPSCGSTVTLTQIIEEGHCPRHLEPDEAEVEGDVEQPREGGCSADLSLELVWEA